MHLIYCLIILSILSGCIKCDNEPLNEIENQNEDDKLIKDLFTKINWLITEIVEINKNINNINERIDLQDNNMTKFSQDFEDFNQTLNQILTEGMETKQELLQKIDQQENLMQKIAENFKTNSPKDMEGFNETLNKIVTKGMDMKQQIFQRIDQQDNVMIKSSKDMEDFNKTLNKILSDGLEMKQQILQKIDVPEKSAKAIEDFNQTLNQILTDGLETKQQLLQKIDQQENVMTKYSKVLENFGETLNKLLTEGLEMKQQIFQRLDLQDNFITKSSKDNIEKTKETCNWLVILRRQDGTVDFDRNWLEYQNGFGFKNGEYFIGLDQLHELTNSAEPQELLVILRDFNDDMRYAKYDHFVVGSASENYKLKKLGSYSGNAGDSLSQHIDCPFSTEDNDNDAYFENCALNHEGGWWFDECYDSHLTGPYFQQPTSNVKNGITWNSWHGGEYSLKFVKMMLRPKSYENCYSMIDEGF